MNTIKPNSNFAPVAASTLAALFCTTHVGHPQQEIKRAKQPATPPATVVSGNKGALIISTIEAPFEPPAYPGTPPAGMYTRLGYTNTPSDDQLVIDTALHADSGLLAFLTTKFNPTTIQTVFGVIGGQAPTVGILTAPAAGSLANATQADKEYLGLAMFARSLNAAPSATFSEGPAVANVPKIEDFENPSSGDFRIVNEYVINATTTTGSTVTAWTLFRKEAIIGPTPFQTFRPTWIRLNVPNAPVPVPVLIPPIPRVNVPNADPSTYTEPDENDAVNPYGNGAETEVLSAPPTSTLIGKRHRAASRIGPMVRPLENHYIWPLIPLPFYSEIEIRGLQLPGAATSYYLVSPWRELDAAQKSRWNWPTHRSYHYNPLTRLYTLDGGHRQVHSPWREPSGAIGTGFLYLSGKSHPQ